VRLGLPVSQEAGLNEVDFGDWTGRTLAELKGTRGWAEFNTVRSSTRIPNGETMAEVIGRAMGVLTRLHRDNPSPGKALAVVSHGDVLRSLVAHVLGMHLDRMQQLEIAPASVSVLSHQSDEWRLLLLNSTEGWPEEITSASR
jgi:probable phosphoglycerate mutase